MEAYEIRYTELARAFLCDRLPLFEARFREELAEFMQECEADDLLLHSMEFEGRLFIGTWREEGWLLIDSAYEEESEVQSGPRKKERIIIPRPDSE